MQQDETLRLLCDEAWTGAHSFALYRQPGEQRYTFVTAASDPQRLTTLSDVGRQSGVVVAPWQAGAASPLLLIPADSVVQGDVPALSGDMPEAPVIDASIGRADYEWGFRRCMDRLSLGVGGLTKVVYARQMAYAYAARRLTMADLFLRACHLSPYSYVTLWHTPRTGFWLVATPEVLVSALGDGRMQTMALAGTMPWTGTLPPLDAWSAKNRHEQQVVAAYIAARLDSMAADVQASPCGSRRAGNVVHLCTTFTFRPAGGRTLGDIVAALHPTYAASPSRPPRPPSAMPSASHASTTPASAVPWASAARPPSTSPCAVPTSCRRAPSSMPAAVCCPTAGSTTSGRKPN